MTTATTRGLLDLDARGESRRGVSTPLSSLDCIYGRKGGEGRGGGSWNECYREMSKKRDTCGFAEHHLSSPLRR